MVTRSRPISDVARPQVDEPKTQRVLEAIVTSVSSLVHFIQPYVQTDPWHLLSYYDATWSDLPAIGLVSVHRPSYRKNPMGRVELRGVAQRSGGAEIIGVLPVGYRPALGVVLPVYTTVGTALIITSDGNMLINGDPGGAAVLSLDGVTFDTEV